MTAVPCPHCDKTCAGPAGLASHIRSLHPEVVREREQQLERDLSREAPPEPATPASNGIVWEDPPSKGGRSKIVDDIIKLIPELRRNPGQWARLHTWTNTSGANGAQTALKKREDLSDIEFVARSSTKDKASSLYGRYVEAE